MVDFGISNFDGAGRRTEVFTKEYLSPEMVAGKNQDHRLDLWAYGVMLYEAFLDKTPFAMGHEEARAMNQMQQKNYFLEAIAQHSAIPFPNTTPVLLKDLVTKILRIQPQDRLSVEEILAHRWWADTTLSE